MTMVASLNEIKLSFFFVLLFSFSVRQTASWQNPLQTATARTSPLFAASAKSQSPPFPRAAVSVAVRCSLDGTAHYLLVQRGNPPNSGQWSFPGGKLKLGETALQGGQRELAEETQFPEQSKLKWYSGTISTADSILPHEDGSTKFHFLIAICFAELGSVQTLPQVQAADDAADAKWWTMEEIQNSSALLTPGLIRHMENAEKLYQSGVLES